MSHLRRFDSCDRAVASDCSTTAPVEVMAPKRASATSQTKGYAKRPRQTSPTPSFECLNQPRPLHAQQSPLLRLPAELRNRIYEFVLGNHFIHVEADSKRNTCKDYPSDKPAWARVMDAQRTSPGRWLSRLCVHYYPCKAAICEEEAYNQSQSASYSKQCAGDHERLANCWRPGDPFYIESCKTRHAKCYPHIDTYKQDWVSVPAVRAHQTFQNTNLARFLGLALLQTCSQVYHETKDLALSANTFSFRDVLALLLLLSTLSATQTARLRSMHIAWSLGLNHRQWNRWILGSSLLANITGLRVLHVSLFVVHAGMGDSGPVRSEYYEGKLGPFITGLECFRKLPLDHVTVIVSDDPDSKFGAEGCVDRYLQYDWDGDFERWLQIRKHQCLTVEEKRQWSRRLRSYLLRETEQVEPN